MLATSGDTHLGGEDFDNRVIDHLVKAYKRKTGTEVSKNERAMGKLKKAVENAKRTLSNQQSTTIEIESFEGGNDFSEVLTRAKFEELNLDLFRRTMKPVEQVLKDSGLSKNQVDEVFRLSLFLSSLLTFVNRSSWSADPLAFRRCNSCLRITLARNPPKVSILTKQLLMVLPSKAPSFPVNDSSAQ